MRFIAALPLCLMLFGPAHADDWDRANNVRPEYSHMMGAVPGHPAPGRRGSVSGLVAPLAAKASEIASACGSRIGSTVRHTNIAGTRRPSLHNYGRAVDISGNPSCIYSHLQGWPGGYSTDYGRVRHVHISYEPNGREWGVRFAHHGGSRHARRHRYAGLR